MPPMARLSGFVPSLRLTPAPRMQSVCVDFPHDDKENIDPRMGLAASTPATHQGPAKRRDRALSPLSGEKGQIATLAPQQQQLQLAAPPTPAPPCVVAEEELECAPTPSAPLVVVFDESAVVAPPTPAPPPVTPAPPRPAGEIAVEQWLDDSGLLSFDGLLPALLHVASDLSKLSELSDEELIEGLKTLQLRSLKMRKITAAMISLRAERDAFKRTISSGSPGGSPNDVALRAPLDIDDGPSPTAAAAHEQPPPPHPRFAERNRAGFGRFVPRTVGGQIHVVPPSPESAATHLGLTGPSEARELGELATLLGGGRPSRRASKWESNIHAGVLASAAAKEAAKAEKMAGEARKEEVLKVCAREPASAPSSAFLFSRCLTCSRPCPSIPQVDASEAHAAFGDLKVRIGVSNRSKKQIDQLRLIDLSTRLEEAAVTRLDLSRVADEGKEVGLSDAGLSLSPERLNMMSANAPRDESARETAATVAQRKKVPRKKQPPVAPSTRQTRSQTANTDAASMPPPGFELR